MKTKFTVILCLMLLAFSAGLKAQQDTVRTLVMTEVSDNAQGVYVELTNIGQDNVNLNNFLIGSVHTWSASLDAADGYGMGTFPSIPDWGIAMRDMGLKDSILAPGEQFIIGVLNDLRDSVVALYGSTNGMSGTYTEQYLWDNVDYGLYRDEYPGDYMYKGNIIPDSADANTANIFTTWGGHNAHALFYDINSNTADATKWWPVDGFKYRLTGVIYDWDNIHPDRRIAGIDKAAGGPWVFVRKTTLTEGDIDWDNARGTDLGDSEWIPIPMRKNTSGKGTKYFSTIGHHGDVTLDASSISSTDYTMDFSAKTITIPFGVLRQFVMDGFTFADGIAWNLDKVTTYNDSLFNTVRTGDSITFYGVGSALSTLSFDVIQAAATDDVNKVFPKNRKVWDEDAEELVWETPYYVTDGEEVIDTIGDLLVGTRVDSLYKYIEKADGASLDIIWVDGTERVDLKLGDILEVTAGNNSTKQYYLDVDEGIIESKIATLSAIVWPDVPDFMRLDPAWQGDTIPQFNPGKTVYTLTLPATIEGVPAIRAFSTDVNASIEIDHAVSLIGSVADRSTVVTVTAADGVSQKSYTITFNIEKPESKIQPFETGPIITELVPADNNKAFVEISNPGTVPVDLSNYVLARNVDAVVLPGQVATAWYDALTVDGWGRRYFRYFFGHDFTPDTATYLSEGPLLYEDLSVNPILKGGESFVVCSRYTGGNQESNALCDVIMAVFPELEEQREAYFTEGVKIIQGIRYTQWSASWVEKGTNHYLYKILNDSVINGLKSPVDPADFELVDLFGDLDNDGSWNVGGVVINSNVKSNFVRKPSIYLGNTDPGTTGSWGTDAETSEWLYYDNTWYSNNLGRSDEMMTLEGLGTHTFNLFTFYLSTISSAVYPVSDGYTSPQDIWVPSNTDVTTFLSNIAKLDEGQTLEVTGKSGTDVLVEGDALVVTSKDASSTTEYTVHIGGLDTDATLTSDVYTIDVDGSTGTISGIVSGTTIKAVMDNITAPAKASSVTVMDDQMDILPMQMRGFDNEYFDIPASSNVYIKVVAEDLINAITYQLIPDGDAGDVFAVSDQFEIDQVNLAINNIPFEISVEKFGSMVSATSGGSYKIYNKNGEERTTGYMNYDDELVLKSADESITKIYILNFVDEPAGTDAYVTSDVLTVDQVGLDISGSADQGTTAADLLAMLTPAEAATMKLTDGSGSEVTGVLTNDGTYHVVVTSGNGSNEVTYAVSVVFETGIASNLVDFINVYPNPADDFILVRGVSIGSKIKVFNVLGETLKAVDTKSIRETHIDISDFEQGIYFVKTENEYGTSNIVKFLKQ